MPNFLRSKKAWLALIGVVVIGIGAAGAFAYWTASGTGTGSAAAGTGTGVTVNQTSAAIADLYPGGPTKALSGNFDNPNNGPAYVASVNASISSVTGPNIDATHPCAAADFQLNGFPVAVGQSVPAGNGQSSWSGASIQMLNAVSNQDGCKGATVHLSYTSN